MARLVRGSFDCESGSCLCSSLRTENFPRLRRLEIFRAVMCIQQSSCVVVWKKNGSTNTVFICVLFSSGLLMFPGV